MVAEKTTLSSTDQDDNISEIELSKEKSFIDEFYDKARSSIMSSRGQELWDCVIILDALGVEKENIKEIIFGLFQGPMTLS